jgi:hypothetical protein
MIDKNDFKSKSKKVKKEEMKGRRENSLQKQQFKAIEKTIESFRKLYHLLTSFYEKVKAVYNI